MIQLRKISKNFGDKRVLDQIDLTLAQSQTHVLLGSSGCGKSTLLRILMGLILPDQGEVFIEGVEPGRSKVRQMGYVLQEGGLFPHLTAEQNVTLVARTLGWTRAKIENRVDELAKLMGFEAGVLKAYPKNLSGGQRQRVGLMRALMLDPPVLLLDEPLGALDPIVRAGLQTELKRIFNSLKKTVVIVTHDMGEAAFFGHSISLLKDGKIIQHGTFEEFVQNPEDPFVSEFINAQKPAPQLKALL